MLVLTIVYVSLHFIAIHSGCCVLYSHQVVLVQSRISYISFGLIFEVLNLSDVFYLGVTRSQL